MLDLLLNSSKEFFIFGILTFFFVASPLDSFLSFLSAKNYYSSVHACYLPFLLDPLNILITVILMSLSNRVIFKSDSVNYLTY